MRAWPRFLTTLLFVVHHEEVFIKQKHFIGICTVAQSLANRRWHIKRTGHDTMVHCGQRLATHLWHLIGVGADRFLGCEGFLPKFPQACPKSFCATFSCKFSLTKIMKTFFVEITQKICSWVWPQKLTKKVFMCFWFEKGSQTLGAIFARIFRDVARIFDK